MRRVTGLLAVWMLSTTTAGAAETHGVNRPVVLGGSLGLAWANEPWYVRGRQVQVFVRPPVLALRLQPRIEFVSQSFDLDAVHLSQATSNLQVDDGDRRLQAALVEVQWNLGPAHRVGPYVVAGGGRAWVRDRWRWNDGRRATATLRHWMVSGGAGIHARIGADGAYVDGRGQHVYFEPWAGSANGALALSAGLEF